MIVMQYICTFVDDMVLCITTVGFYGVEHNHPKAWDAQDGDETCLMARRPQADDVMR